jgi:Transposase, Mutator family
VADSEEDIVAFDAFPVAHWSKLHSTNPLERFNQHLGDLRQPPHERGDRLGKAVVRLVPGVGLRRSAGAERKHCTSCCRLLPSLPRVSGAV